MRIREIERGRQLVTEVLEQTIERKALLLHQVTLTCRPIGVERTRVAVRTDFEPRMGPRWYWRPFERFFGRSSFEALLGA
ncbi:MAG: hypothetical protein EXS13_11610 [Planctomycetes bacterium]|nr:hypothetical protein [Planctomycetota bacterium]